MDQQERRRFFRIEDSLGVSYQRISDAEAAQHQAQQHNSQLQALDGFESRIRSLIEASRIQTPIVAELADLLNKKLNLLINQLEIDEKLLMHTPIKLHDVNISACGMAFQLDEAVPEGDRLLIELQLLPDDTRMQIVARSVACIQKDNGYQIRLEFHDMAVDDQELLIQHIVRRQSRLLTRERKKKQGD